jgi:hypothetical protein
MTEEKQFRRVRDQKDHMWWGDDEKRDWYLAIGQSRDSDLIEKSNYRVVLSQLNEKFPADPETEQIDWEDAHESHWAVGWVETIIINPANQALVDFFLEIKAQLENYPILDESDWSNLEVEEHDEHHQEYPNTDECSICEGDLSAHEYSKRDGGPCPNEDRYENGCPWCRMNQEAADKEAEEKLTAENKRKALAVSSQFFYSIGGYMNSERSWIPAPQAERVTLPGHPDILCFVKADYNELWEIVDHYTVTEMFSGAALGSGQTKEAAITNTLRYLNNAYIPIWASISHAMRRVTIHNPNF